jgi:hypothetical protein
MWDVLHREDDEKISDSDKDRQYSQPTDHIPSYFLGINPMQGRLGFGYAVSIVPIDVVFLRQNISNIFLSTC